LRIRQWARGWGLLIAAVFVPVLAGAAGKVWLGGASSPVTAGNAPLSVPSAALPASDPRGASPSSSAALAGSEATRREAPTASVAGGTAAESRARPRAAPASSPPTSELTAAELFRRAGLARREGKLAQARATFLELERRFPDSEEARLARVSLGKLLLDTGDADQALRQFDEYLGARSGALAEEALVGRAQALGRLGRAVEEERVWRDLLSRYPRSVYAARARQRLDELGAATR
jgi:TolA-binding protein